MTFDDVSKKIMMGEKIYNLPLRVCFYARVSTDSDVQMNSLENQFTYYEEYIKSKPNWVYVGGYVEEGVSGVSVLKRESFKKMIRDAMNGKFDLIVTKEVSRFARDLEDSIHYIRKLKNNNVGILFENQNLNTFDSNSELILNIMFNLAQDESRKLSERVKFGHREAILKGHVLGSSNIIGYKKDKCRLVVVPEEALFIKKLFSLYATGEYGFYRLSRALADLGYRNKNNNFYDKDSLKRMLKNPKYKGYYRAKTYEVIDYRTKKRKKIKEDEQIIYECLDGSIPAIVSSELWDKANDILNMRTKRYKGNNYCSLGLKYPFSSKLYCSEHNTTFQRSHGKKGKGRSTWCCSRYLQYRLSACVSPIICENDLYYIFKNIMNNVIREKNVIIESLLGLYGSIDKTNRYDIELDNISKSIQMIESKKSNALDLVFSGELKKEQLRVQFDNFEKEKNVLLKKRDDIVNQMEILRHCSNNTDEIYNEILEELDGGIIDDFIRKFVDGVIISKIDNDRYNIHMDIYLDLLGEGRFNYSEVKHVAGNKNDILYMENCTSDTTEVRKGKLNKFTYNVYIKCCDC